MNNLLAFVLLSSFPQQGLLYVLQTKFTNIECGAHPEWFASNVSCEIKAFKRNSNLLNGYGFIIKPIKKDVLINFKLFKRFSGYKPFLIDVSIDFCKWVNKPRSNPYMKIIREMIEKYSNVNHTCPYKGDIIVRKLRGDVAYIPNFWPNGDYRLNVRTYEKSNPDVEIAYGRVYFNVQGDDEY